MTTMLKANFLYMGIEDDIIMVGFADDEFDTQEYILLQKSIVWDEQDKELGSDKIHITYRDQSQSAYGGILKFILKNGSINILLDVSTADALKTENQIGIEFLADASNLADLKQYLQKMFDNESEIFISEV